MDSAGVPVKGLTADNFSVVEDAKPMVIESLAPADDPISLIMAIDTSGSMAGPAINSAKDAANSFLLGMGNDDQVAILSFNNTVKPVIDFTTDRQAAGQQLSLIEAVPNSDTCLYDAAYQAVQNIAALAPGRRAVILFTDGVDEGYNGKPCSTYTIDDVIHLATGGNSAIPIYTLGLGYHVDEQSLQRLASLTGGRFQYAPTSDQLGAIFKNLSDQLKSQYLLTYLTTSAQGSHTLVIQATTPSGSVKDTRNFISPAMPAGILIKSPTDGQSILGKQVISAVLTGSAEEVQKVVFYVGGKDVGEVTAPPYDFNFEFTSSFAGTTTIDVVAQSASGDVIAKQSINVNVVVPTATVGAPTPNNTFVSIPNSITSSVNKLSGLPLYLIIGGIVLLLGILVFLIFRKRKKGESGGNNPIPTLEVVASDDPMFIGKRFEIQQPITKLGRLVADNDIAFPSDSPVSGQHAIIKRKGEKLYISEVSKGSTYGTFVNESKIGSTAVLLNDNAKIRLGSRLILRILKQKESDGGTIDNLIIPDEHGTIDHLLPPKKTHDPFETQETEK
jgi:VWFA-related protein